MADSSPNPAPHRYRSHGLVFDSDLEFPELARDGGNDAPDVTVRFGRVPRKIENPRQSGVCYQARAGEMLLWLEGVARFHVAEGRTITIERGAAATDVAIRALALSSPLAALLLQRGLLTLHASAVVTPHGAVVFAGSAAQGKSTLAAEFARRGSAVLADGIVALRVDEDGGAFALPGAPVLRLWPDALAAIGAEAGAPILRRGVARRLLSYAGESSAGAIPVTVIYVLERGEVPQSGPSLVQFTRKDALVALLDAVYRPAFVHGLRVERQVFAQVERLARGTRVVRAIAPVAERILEDLAR